MYGNVLLGMGDKSDDRAMVWKVWEGYSDDMAMLQNVWDVVLGMGCVWWCAMYGDVAVVLDMEGTWWCDMGVERMGMWNGMWEVRFELYRDVT